MLVEAERLQCEEEMITIVSMLSVPDIFYRPPQRAEESDKAREKFFAPESDHLTLLNTYNQCRRKKFSSKFCSKHFIHHKAILKARDIRAQLCEEIKKNKRYEMRSKRISGSSTGQGRAESLTLSSCGTHWDLVREALCAAYLLQVGRMKGLMQYVNLLTGIPAHLHPSSALCGMGQTPEYVVYHELVLTSKEYMRAVTAVDPKWLAQLGPMFYSIKGVDEERKKDSSSSDSEDTSSSETSSSTSDDLPQPENSGYDKPVSKNHDKDDDDPDPDDLLRKMHNKMRSRKRQRRGV